jgi:hypothetical protein
MEKCPFNGLLADECGIGTRPRTDEHVEWHLERGVRLGELVKNDDGSYSLPGEGDDG